MLVLVVFVVVLVAALWSWPAGRNKRATVLAAALLGVLTGQSSSPAVGLVDSGGENYCNGKKHSTVAGAALIRSEIGPKSNGALEGLRRAVATDGRAYDAAKPNAQDVGTATVPGEFTLQLPHLPSGTEALTPEYDGRQRSRVSRTSVATNSGAKLSGRTVLGENWDDAIRAARGIKPEAGYFDVIAHGTPGSVFDAAGNALSPSELAGVIRGTPSWGGQPVRLVACSTGCPTGTFAQALADELGVAVKAPTTDFLVNSRGTVVFDPGGGWRTVQPR
jgi:hypothetical protein